jgi:hypothetical protein
MDRDKPTEVLISVRCPRWLPTAIKRAARRELISKSDFVRRAVLRDLEAAGALDQVGA